MQGFDDRWIDCIDFADEADIEKLAGIITVGHFHFAGADQTTVFTGQTNCLTAVVIDEHDDILLHFAAQHPFDDFHGFFIGDTHTLDEGALLANFFQCVIDLRATTMHDHRIHAD